MNPLASILLLLLVPGAAHAQVSGRTTAPSSEKYGFSAGYFGDRLGNPGVQLGAEKYLARAGNFTVISSLHAQYYDRKDGQSAVAATARIGQRYTTGFGVFLESYLGAGVQQTFYTRKTFDYSTGPATVSEARQSKTGFTPSLTLGLGYDFGQATRLPVKLYARPSVYWVYPDQNLAFQSTYALETGLVFVPRFR